jgi:hypothetical protein
MNSTGIFSKKGWFYMLFLQENSIEITQGLKPTVLCNFTDIVLRIDQ